MSDSQIAYEHGVVEVGSMIQEIIVKDKEFYKLIINTSHKITGT